MGLILSGQMCTNNSWEAFICCRELIGTVFLTVVGFCFSPQLQLLPASTEGSCGIQPSGTVGVLQQGQTKFIKFSTWLPSQQNQAWYLSWNCQTFSSFFSFAARDYSNSAGLADLMLMAQFRRAIVKCISHISVVTGSMNLSKEARCPESLHFCLITASWSKSLCLICHLCTVLFVRVSPRYRDWELTWHTNINLVQGYFSL